MSTGVYPFLLKPTGKDYLWGGQRLNTEFEKNIDMSPLAETWECSTHPEGPSFVACGEFEGKEYLVFPGTTSIGNNSKNTIVLFKDKLVGPHHCDIVMLSLIFLQKI